MKYRISLISIAIIIVFFICSCKQKELPKLELTAADVQDLNYPTTQGLVRMDEFLNNWTNGRIRIKIFPSGSLGPEQDITEQTKIGSIDICRVSIAPLSDIVNDFKLYLLPYLFKDSDHMFRVLDSNIGQDILNNLEPYGFIGLAYYDAGQRSFYTTKKPIRTIKDFKGLRIRVQKSDMMYDLIKALGAIPVEQNFEEVYSSLYTGIIDGAENNFPSYVSKLHYKVARYYTVDSHTMIPEIVLFSKKKWITLSKNDKELIKKAAVDSANYQRKLWSEYVEESKKIAGKEGCEIISDIDKEELLNAMQMIYTKYAKGFEDKIDAIRKMR